MNGPRDDEWWIRFKHMLKFRRGLRRDKQNSGKGKVFPTYRRDFSGAFLGGFFDGRHGGIVKTSFSLFSSFIRLLILNAVVNTRQLAAVENPRGMFGREYFSTLLNR